MSVAQTEMKIVKIGITVKCVCLLYSWVVFHSQIAGSHLWATCPHNYSHYTLSRSLFIVTFCHITSGGKWHFIFYPQTSLKRHYGCCTLPRVHVSSSKSHPLIFDNLLSMQNVPLSPTLPVSLRISAVTNWQSCRMTLHHLTPRRIHGWLIWPKYSPCGSFTFVFGHFEPLWSCLVRFFFISVSVVSIVCIGYMSWLTVF